MSSITESDPRNRPANFVNSKSILEAKATLTKNEIEPQKILRIEADSWSEAYFKIGTEFSQPIKASFNDVFDAATEEEKHEKDVRVDVAKKLAIKLKEIAGEDSELGNNVKELVDSLVGWAEGSGLDEEGKKHGLSSLEAALIMESDNMGCQSFMGRTKDGGIILMHTEEDKDLSERVTKFHYAEIKVGNEVKSSFVYNNLLPGGAACGEGDGFLMATDYLNINTVPKQSGHFGLVNTASWLIWKMGKDATEEKIKEVVEKLGPFIDGYAINIARRNPDGTISAQKILFAGDAFEIQTLDYKAGSHLEQTNLIDPKLDNKELQSYAKTPYSMPETPDKMAKTYYKKYQKRIRRIGLMANFFKNKYGEDLSKQKTEDIHLAMHKVMSIRTRQNWGLANKTVGATFSGYLGATHQSSAVGVGPALRDIQAEDLHIKE